MNPDLPLCNKCLREILAGKGMRITSMDTGNESYYCTACLRDAMNKLSMKTNKRVDEVELLSGIRRFLKHTKN